MKRSFEAEFINHVLNHPEVKDGTEFDGIADLTDIIADYNNVLLINDYGGFLYVKLDATTYEVHTQLLPEGRGQRALNAAKESLRDMFINTDCMRVISKARPENTGACQLASKCLNHKGFNGAYNYYSLEYMDWVERDTLNKVGGDVFHELVEGNTNHDDDDTHDYHVGAAIDIAKAGNATKAVQVYNYWAIASGYEKANIHSLNPLIVGIGDMTLLINNTVEVI